MFQMIFCLQIGCFFLAIKHTIKSNVLLYFLVNSIPDCSHAYSPTPSTEILQISRILLLSFKSHFVNEDCP